MTPRYKHASRVVADVKAGPIVAAFASLGAAAIHLASASDHYSEWWGAGVFFYAVSMFQIAWAMTALRASGPPIMLLGLVGNGGVMATWAISRTVGVPVGPSAGVPEAVTQVGVTAIAFEVVICAVALWHLRGRGTRGFASSQRAAILVGAASATMTGLTVPAVQGAISHSHGGAEESSPHQHDEDDGQRSDDGEPQDAGTGTNRDAGAEEATPTPAPEDSRTPGTTQEPPDEGDGHDDAPHDH